jgi:hypothetical protein
MCKGFGNGRLRIGGVHLVEKRVAGKRVGVYFFHATRGLLTEACTQHSLIKFTKSMASFLTTLISWSFSILEGLVRMRIRCYWQGRYRQTSRMTLGGLEKVLKGREDDESISYELG